MFHNKWDIHSKDMQKHDRLLFSPHRLKSNSGMETLPSGSGAFLCLLESGEPLAFWFKTPNRVRLRVDSRGRTATAIGKLILGETRPSKTKERTEQIACCSPEGNVKEGRRENVYTYLSNKETRDEKKKAKGKK